MTTMTGGRKGRVNEVGKVSVCSCGFILNEQNLEHVGLQSCDKIGACKVV